MAGATSSIGQTETVDRVKGTPRDAAARARDYESYANCRAEWAWGLRDRLEQSEIDLDPEDEELIEQLVDALGLGDRRDRPHERAQVERACAALGKVCEDVARVDDAGDTVERSLVDRQASAPA